MRAHLDRFAGTLRRFHEGVRYVRDLLGEPIRIGSLAGTVRQRTADRTGAFLETVEHTIFANPDSPYRPLLDMAGIGLPRLKTLVAERGLEETLHTLARSGVYVAIEEFKGRRELQRGERTYRTSAAAFRNPSVKSGLVASSGGTRSPGLASTIAPSNHRLGAQHLGLALSAYGLEAAPVIVWLAYAHGAGLWAVLALLALGNQTPYWFSQLPAAVVGRGGVYARYLGIRAAALSRGRRVPPITHVPVGQERSVLGRVTDQLRRRGRCGIFTTPSAALRLALAATRSGQTLEGVTFVTIAEPLTPVKLAGIRSVGARAFSSLGFTELGRATYGCVAPEGPDDTHVCRDAVAVIQRTRPVGRAGTPVDALLLTGLQPDSRNIFLNMETGDYATLSSRRCGCPFETLGWTEHLTDIRSFEKLNAEGPPFSGSKLISLVEEILPERFGGDATDYQLLEEEDADGFTRLSILVHPRLGPVDEQRVLACATEQLWTTHGKTASRIWQEAGTLKLRRAEPMLTKAGKFQPLHHLSSRPE